MKLEGLVVGMGIPKSGGRGFRDPKLLLDEAAGISKNIRKKKIKPDEVPLAIHKIITLYKEASEEYVAKNNFERAGATLSTLSTYEFEHGNASDALLTRSKATEAYLNAAKEVKEKNKRVAQYHLRFADSLVSSIEAVYIDKKGKNLDLEEVRKLGINLRNKLIEVQNICGQVTN